MKRSSEDGGNRKKKRTPKHIIMKGNLEEDVGCEGMCLDRRGQGSEVRSECGEEQQERQTGRERENKERHA